MQAPSNNIRSFQLLPQCVREGFKKDSKITQFFYVFIIYMSTKFGENFEEKIDICLFLNVLVEKVEAKKSD